MTTQQTVVQTQKLTKRYGKATVVENFDLTVQRGRIHGLIGPNGAGKTTIMRVLAGLALQDSGTVALFGQSDALEQQRSRMSFMIETPMIDKQMTARENMCYIRYVRGVADESRIDTLLDFVGLGAVGTKRAGKFSLGMKQRLGIAMALLTEPEVLVLDEPVNGLDPEGIVEIRRMLLRLCEEKNTTIIISSHLLSELSELCTDFTILSGGRLIETFSAEQLAEKCKNHICIRTTDINKTAAILEETLSLHAYQVKHGEEIFLYERLEEIEQISKAITDRGLILTKLCVEGENLEQYYLSKVGGQNA